MALPFGSSGLNLEANTKSYEKKSKKRSCNVKAFVFREITKRSCFCPLIYFKMKKLIGRLHWVTWLFYILRQIIAIWNSIKWYNWWATNANDRLRYIFKVDLLYVQSYRNTQTTILFSNKKRLQFIHWYTKIIQTMMISPDISLRWVCHIHNMVHIGNITTFRLTLFTIMV